MRFLVVVVTAVVLAFIGGTAGAAPQRDALIRPGLGIGNVHLGMTFAEARRALGRPQHVLKQRRFGFGSRYAEYGWGWGGTDWIVAVTGRGDRARVVMVATGLRRERTRIRRVGVGSTDEAVRRALGARCDGKNTGYYPSVYKDTMWCFLGVRRSTAHTAFSLIEDCQINPLPAHAECPPSKRVYRVYEVRVAEPRFIWGYHGR
ncbi:MAG: hypothetical protein ACRDN6_11485 [Gaiellaceae bacterium]